MLRSRGQSAAPPGFADITERAGEPATPRQIADMAHRYRWAAGESSGLRVLEVACGTGQGLGILHKAARSLLACDLEPKNVETAQRVHAGRISVKLGSALELPVAAGEVDVVILFEALYYLPDAAAFLAECRRVLSPSGRILLSTTNPDLFDFTPSPLSRRYYGAGDLGALLQASGFRADIFGYDRAASLPLRQRLLRPLKVVAGNLGLLPRTMRGKALVRRILFGRLPVMPTDLDDAPHVDAPLEPIPVGSPDRVHRFLYLVGTRDEKVIVHAPS